MSVQWPDGYSADYAYDTSGRRASVTLGNGAVTSYSYHEDDALQTLGHNMTGAADDVDWNYGFNRVNQLTGKIMNGGVNLALYKWEPQYKKTDAYVSNGLNQYGSVAGAGLSYDAAGNLTSDGVWSYSYDVENMLIAASRPGLSASYLYDPLGRRSAKTVDGALTSFLHDGVEEIADYNSSGVLLRRYVHGPGVDEYLVMYVGSGTANKSYYHANHQGSIIAMSDNSGSVTETHAYSPYGMGEGDDTGNPFRYTGRRLDEETGLYYYRSRYMSPAIGRFLQTDPIGYGDGLNWYAYVGNDPLNYFDPLGQCRVTEDDQLDCEEAPENEDDLTEEQKEAIDKVRQAFIKIGKEIQENGTKEQKQAWEDITSITFNIKEKAKDEQGNESDDTLAQNNLNKDAITVFLPGFNLNRSIDRKHMAAHEIFHSEKFNKRSALKAKTWTQRNFMEKQTDRMAIKFIRNRFDPNFLVKIGYFQ